FRIEVVREALLRGAIKSHRSAARTTGDHSREDSVLDAYHRANVVLVGPGFPMVGRHGHSRKLVFVHKAEVEKAAVVHRNGRITFTSGSSGNRPHLPSSPVVLRESHPVFVRIDLSTAHRVRNID